MSPPIRPFMTRSRRFHRKTSAACANDDANAKTNANAELTRFVHLVFFFFSVFFMDSGPTRSRIRLNPPRMPSTTHPGLPRCHVSPANDHRPLGPGTAIRPRINTTHRTSKLPPATCTGLPRPVPRLHHRASNRPPRIQLGPPTSRHGPLRAAAYYLPQHHCPPHVAAHAAPQHQPLPTQHGCATSILAHHTSPPIHCHHMPPPAPLLNSTTAHPTWPRTATYHHHHAAPLPTQLGRAHCHPSPPWPITCRRPPYTSSNSACMSLLSPCLKPTSPCYVA